MNASIIIPPSEHFMECALGLAELGRGFVHPNPLVGAVIVRGGVSTPMGGVSAPMEGRIIGEGRHEIYGGPHAEINALADAAARKEPTAGAEMYVTLEPCCHHGKTPPCSDALINARIARVIYAMEDPHRIVAGGGHRALEAAGIVTCCGMLEKKARKLNEAYIHFLKYQTPFVTWKTARTLDGAVTLRPGTVTALTGPEARDYVDTLRARADAVMVGVNTVIIDDPGLRVRNPDIRKSYGRDPYRIVIDTSLRIPPTSRLLTENIDRKTIVITGRTPPYPASTGIDAEIMTTPLKDGRVDLSHAMRALAEKGIIDILLESGPTLGNAMVNAGLIRRVIVLQAPVLAGTAASAGFGDGKSWGTLSQQDLLGRDTRKIYELKFK